MPKLIAKERFYYNGRNLEVGEEFEALSQDVDLLTHSVSPRARNANAPLIETGNTAPQKRRQYRRRDMIAQED